MDQLILPYPITDANDDPIAGALLDVYQTGTTTLSTDIFSDEAGTSAHTNPVECDGAGRPPQIFFNGGYGVRVRARTPTGATIWDIDPVTRASSTTTAATNISFIPGDTNPATNVQEAIDNLQEDVDLAVLSAGRMDPGTAAAPGLKFDNDTDTGFFREASNIIAATQGGVSIGGLIGRKNLLGTVSQSGGVPTGAALESSTGSNGTYLLLADGTQIAWHAVTTTVDIDTASTSYDFRTASTVNWTPTRVFTGTPLILANARNCTGVALDSYTAGTAAFYPFSTTSRTGVSVNLYFLAFGRWY